jgi:hypothetical protein
MRKTFFLLLISFSCLTAKAQQVSINGYVKDMLAAYILENPVRISPENEFKWTAFNLVHNRINLDWTPSEDFKFHVGLRNRIFSGKMIKDINGYAGFTKADNGLVDLSWNVAEKSNWFANTSIDRIFAEYTLRNFQLRAGRQRINWGINLVWNPNDLFNAFSYTDFDYEERPGSDAVLLTWYTSPSSNLDIAVKTDSSRKFTAAARYLFNIYDYDIQFIGGKDKDDIVFGMGWSGNIGDYSFRGEGSIFKSVNSNTNDNKTAVSATISTDRTFENSMFIHFSILYNSSGTSESGSGISLLDPNLTLSAKRLSSGKFETFGQISYPINPLINLNIATIFNPVDKSAYIGPSANISLTDNIDLLFTAQILTGKEKSEYAYFGNTYCLFGRLKWSF